MKAILTAPSIVGKHVESLKDKKRFKYATKLNQYEAERFNELLKRFNIEQSRLVKYGLELAYQELKEIKNRTELKRIIKKEQANND